MNWLIFFVGVLLGWLIEWTIDVFFWRRKMRTVAQANVDLEEDVSRLKQEKQALEVLAKQVRGQEAELQSGRASLQAKESELEVASKRLTELSATADTRRTQLVKEEQRIADCEADLKARRVELDVLSQELAVSKSALDACRADCSAAQARAQTLQVELEAALAAAAAPLEPQSLHEIEGIGPKIESILYSHGILTHRQLAATSLDRLGQILEEAGSRFRLADPSTWPEQARLAANEDWDALKAFQDRLIGGRAVDNGPGLAR